MQTLPELQHILGAAAREPKPAVVIMYEDFTSGLRAKALFDQFLTPLTQARSYSLDLWKFQILRLEVFRAEALRDTVAAHIVCIAGMADGALPLCVQTWADRWAHERPNNPATLIALLENECDETLLQSERATFLRDIARRARAEFLVLPSSASPALSSVHIHKMHDQLYDENYHLNCP